MPASVTSSTRAPPASSSTSSGVRAVSLPSKYDTTRPFGVTPSAWVSRRSRRVSSAATTSAPASSSASRGGASEMSPMGVPASTRVPVTRPSSQERTEAGHTAHARDSPGAVPYDGAVTSTASSTDTRQEQSPLEQRQTWQHRLRRFGHPASAVRGDVRDRLVPPYTEPSGRLWKTLGVPPALSGRLVRWSGWGGPLLVTLVAGCCASGTWATPRR